MVCCTQVNVGLVHHDEACRHWAIAPLLFYRAKVRSYSPFNALF